MARVIEFNKATIPAILRAFPETEQTWAEIIAEEYTSETNYFVFDITLHIRYRIMTETRLRELYDVPRVLIAPAFITVAPK